MIECKYDHNDIKTFEIYIKVCYNYNANIHIIKRGINVINKKLKKQAHSLVQFAKANGLITNYKEFLAKESALTGEEILYYTSKKGCEQK